MQGTSLYYGLLGLLAIALLFAAFTDMRHRRIDNWLNAAIALVAPLFWWAGGMSLYPDIALQIGFFLVVFAILLGCWTLRLIGGGDIKLLAALALWISPQPFLRLLVVMALAGGVIAVLHGAWHVIRRKKHRPVVPYGVAIAIGGLWVIGIDHANLAFNGSLVG